ncbi:MerR family transcriptional regulator [Burkholderia alba]|uniref:MerR family transcriptional regulator n=1 Tax=Burkholderia alba TaxID=2683677 RepID=UPI002B055FC5|nr:MerR family transcriptional regulator [Burkholderia alba]
MSNASKKTPPNALTIGQVAELIGVSTHTLRYYEQAGLLRAIARTGAGHRLYAPADLDWLRFVLRLKATGMPIAGIQAFALLRDAGDATVGERRVLLASHRDAVLAQIGQLQSNLAAITDKIAHYASLERDMTQSARPPGERISQEQESSWNNPKSGRQRTRATNKAGAS